MDDLGISASLAGALLIKYGWNTSAVNDKFCMDPELTTTLFKFELGASKPKKPDFCPCCCEEADDWVAMEDCGHTLCRDCFTGYLVSKLSDGAECVFTICPE